MYTNPYGEDPQETDPAALRRKAILGLMDGPSRTTQASTPYTPPVANTYPGAQTAGLPSSSPRDTASGSDTPDLPDPVNPYGGTPAPAGTAPRDNGLQYGSQILDLYSKPYERRGGGTGGIGSGAVTGASIGSVAGPIGAGAGALIGGIVGAARKHAESAPTDFTVQDASQIIRDSYRDMFGREATDAEVHDALAGQGLTDGRYVGQQGLMGVLGHLAENAATERAAGGGATAAATGAGAGAGGAADAGTSTSPAAQAGAATTSAGTGGVPGNVEGVDAAKWNDPNKHDAKYDVLHALSRFGSLDAAWDTIKTLYPDATKIGSDVIDMGDGFGPIDIQRDSDGGGGFHWEPVGGADSGAASAAPAAASTVPPASLGAAQLAAPLTNNNVLQQIMDEVQRIQRGDAPRNAILSQMGLA